MIAEGGTAKYPNHTNSPVGNTAVTATDALPKDGRGAAAVVPELSSALLAFACFAVGGLMSSGWGFLIV